MRKDIEIERDSALRGILFESDEPIAYAQDDMCIDTNKPVCILLIPDGVMAFLEKYILAVNSGKEHCWWKPQREILDDKS